MPSPEPIVRVRTIVGATLLASAVWLYASGAYGAIDPSRFRGWIQDAGGWGWLLFLLVYVVLQPLGVRSVFFVVSAPLIWNPAQAVVLSWIAAVVASALSFGLARFIARDWAQRRVPARLRRFDERLARDGFRTVAMLRLVLYTTPALQLALGVSGVRFKPYLLGTAVGVVPLTLVLTLFGAQVSTWISGVWQ